jgi:hypothetical protein
MGKAMKNLSRSRQLNYAFDAKRTFRWITADTFPTCEIESEVLYSIFSGRWSQEASFIEAEANGFFSIQQLLD